MQDRIKPKSLGQWQAEGFSEDEIRAYSLIGLVVDDDPGVLMPTAVRAAWVLLEELADSVWLTGSQRMKVEVVLALCRDAVTALDEAGSA